MQFLRYALVIGQEIDSLVFNSISEIPKNSLTCLEAVKNLFLDLKIIIMKTISVIFPTTYSYLSRLFLGMFLCLGLNSTAQERLNIPALEVQETFDFLKEFAIDNAYFILNMDKKGHWLQVKWIADKKQFFKNTRYYRVNFLVSPLKSGGSMLTVQMNEEVLRKGSEGGGYYDDEGVVREGKHLELLMEQLQAFFVDRRI